MIAFRELVEGHPARQAANRFTSASLANLRWIYDQMLELVGRAKQGEWSDGPFETALQLDAAFHRELLDAAGNPMATRLVEDLRLMSRLVDALEDPARDVLDRLSGFHSNHLVLVSCWLLVLKQGASLCNSVMLI